MSAVELVGISKTFGSSVALSDLHLDIASGELVCLLGPSGCGKTTALRVLAGFEPPDTGRVIIDGSDVTALPPQKRRFGMVFQDYSLFPNLTARQNVEFGLQVRKVATRERHDTVDRLLDVTRLDEHADKYPHQLSGGQKQRVALARALATAPRVLLLDEPLSALDAKVRESLRGEIRRLQQETGVTTLFVTHDQHEAMAVADRVGVMQDGALVQIDPPEQLYSRPATPFVATFVGTVNDVTLRRDAAAGWVLLGTPVDVVPMPGVVPGSVARAVIRPEQVHVTVPGQDPSRGVPGRVISTAFLGALTRLTVTLGSDGDLVADMFATEASGLQPGHAVSVSVRMGAGPIVLTEGA